MTYLRFDRDGFHVCRDADSEALSILAAILSDYEDVIAGTPDVANDPASDAYAWRQKAHALLKTRGA